MKRIIAALSLAALFACGNADRSRVGGAVADSSGTNSNATSVVSPSATASTSADSASHLRNVVFLGTSLTAGLGVGPDVAFPAVVQEKIDSARLPFHVINAGVSGETSAGGLRRIDWLLQSPVDVLVLELGANDGLRALNVDSMKHNLDEILSRAHAKYPDAALVVVGMEAPPNLGDAYTSKFRKVFSDVAATHHATLVPFLLAGVAGDRSLNQEDGMHPNIAGHRIAGGNVWKVVGPLLVRRARAPN